MRLPHSKSWTANNSTGHTYYLHIRQMPSAKEEVGQAKAILGWGENDLRYINWRRGVKAWARVNGVTGKRMAGKTLWSSLRTHARSETGLPASGRRLLEGGVAGMRRKAETALDNLLQDVLKKARETERRYNALHLAQFAAHSPTTSDAARCTPGSEGQEFRKPVRIFIVDPARGNEVKDARGQYMWDGCPSQCVAMVNVASLAELVGKVRERIPARRTIRAIYGALANPVPPSMVPEATRLQSDEEVEAFFEVTCSKPIRLQFVLHRDPTAKPTVVRDTPPPDHGAYFPMDLFGAPEEHNNDSAEDSDTLPQDSPGTSRRVLLPRTEVNFEERKARIRKRIKTQKNAMKTRPNKNCR